MKCIHCGSEWNVSPGMSASITNCPFCGKSLLPEKKQFNTVEDVLVEISRLFGVSILTDEAKLVAYFSDLAPQLSRQRRILGYFVECNGPKKLASVRNSSDDEQSICIKQIVREMKDEMYIEEAASQMICEAFLFAVSGRRQLTHSAEVTTVNTPKTLVKPETSSWSATTEMTAEEQYQKGEIYYNGTVPGDVLSKDYLKAVEWYQKAADRGYIPAQKRLGFMYVHGEGVQQDRKLAFSWYMKAAKQGDIEAQYKIGLAFLRGNGVAIDIEQAIYWLTLAAEGKYSPAQESLGYVYMNGKQDYVQAAYWLEKAESQGRISASSALKLCKEKRLDTVQNNLKPAAQGNKVTQALPKDLDRKELTEERVDTLVKKYHLESRYFVKGTAEFNKKIMNAVSTYAATAPSENPLLLYDNTVFGSAKEGFLLTTKTLFYNGGFMGGKGQFSIAKIESVTKFLEQINRVVPYTANKSETARLEAFWKELLCLGQ